ncbi:MAG: chitobiase/beta-hexosaminidase C-terminal domain-containing protein [Limisphaerales bacterium]
MNDFVELQEDLTQGLLAEPGLRFINVIQYRKLRLQSEIDWSTVYTAPRNGRSGCGILVEMPAFEVLHPNVSGPVGNLVLSCVALEEPNLNYAPATGTQMSAEEVSKFILDSSHQWEIGGAGVMSAVREAIRGLWRTENLRVVGEGTLRDAIWDAQRFAGLVAYRIKLQMQAAATPVGRVNPPAAQTRPSGVSLSSATMGAEIFYTWDGSFPGPGNPRATKYSAPFPPAGPVLRYAAYKPGMFRSSVVRQQF